MPIVKGTTGDDALFIEQASDISALAGNDTIDLVATNAGYRINGGKGVDTLRLVDQSTFGGFFGLLSLAGIERLEFDSIYDTSLTARIDFMVRDGATGRVNVPLPATIVGGNGGDMLAITVVGGMKSATEIALPQITFINWDTTSGTYRQQAEQVMLRAGDNADYTLRANSFIGGQGKVQTLVGARGNDILLGSSGNDILIDRGGGTTQMAGGAGDDYLLLDLRGAGPVTTIFGTIDGGGGTDILALQSAVNFAGTLQSVEELDILSNMTLNGSLGKISTLVLGAFQGDPFYDWTSADLHLIGPTELPGLLNLKGSGRLTITGASQFDASRWVIEPDNDYPAKHIDIVITGTAGDDRLIGSNTGLSFDSAADLQFGDWFHATLGNDVIDGGTSLDLLDFDDEAFSGGITLNLGTAAVQKIAPGATLSIRNIEEVTGTSFNDTITAAAFQNTIHGGNGDDVLKARAGTGTLYGPRDNPVGDNLFGDAGNDRLIGSSGRDYMDGGDGEDLLVAGSAASKADGDTLAGGNGNDRLIGSAGADYLGGDAGDDILTGSDGIAVLGGDYLSGGDGNDRITGSWASDRLFGGAGNDVLIGRGGDGTASGDTLDGGDGDDLLVGGIGSDSFYTGAGEDHIRFNAIPTQQVFVDKVWWDSEGLDRIELSRATFTAFAKSGALSADAFYTGAGVTAAHDETDRILYDTTSGMLFYDADGNGTVRGAIPIARFYPVDGLVPVLEASDFLIVA